MRSHWVPSNGFAWRVIEDDTGSHYQYMLCAKRAVNRENAYATDHLENTGKKRNIRNNLEPAGIVMDATMSLIRQVFDCHTLDKEYPRQEEVE